MDEQQAQNPTLSERGPTLSQRVRVGAGTCAASVGAATLAIAVALISMAAVVLLLGVFGVDPAPGALTEALQDAAVLLYVVQLVGVSFFNHTAELRFAAVPGLVLVGLSVVAATAATARMARGSSRRKLTIAFLTPIPYAALMGLGALLVPLHFTAPGYGVGVAVSPSPLEAFVLPLVWGVLFAALGGALGAFGRGWRGAAARSLGVWARPLASSLRVLALSLLASAGLALIGSVAIVGGDLDSVAGGGFTHMLGVVGAAIVALPTLAAAVLVAGFSVPLDWQVDALAHGEGSTSVFGGTLPSSSAGVGQAQGTPEMMVLSSVIALVAVLSIGWLSARRAGADARLCMTNVARAAAIVTFAVWLLALLARIDAQAGGLLGFQLAPDTSALLWRVPLMAFAGGTAGSCAYVLIHGIAPRRQFGAWLAGAFLPERWSVNTNRFSVIGRGWTRHAVLSLSFVSVPLALVAVTSPGAATSAAPERVSLDPIGRAAERALQGKSRGDESVEVTVDPGTRVLSTATVDTPLRALGIAPGTGGAAKAKDVLDHYGDLFGLRNPVTELGDPEVITDELGATSVSFTQLEEGFPVFTGGITVHLSDKGELLKFVSNSVIPDISLADPKPRLSRARAITVAKKALPGGRLADPVTMQVYAGLPSYLSPSNARLAWFVWLIDDNSHESGEYVIDAITGQILDTVPKTRHVAERNVYDWGEGPELPGELVRDDEGPESEDPDAENAYQHMGDIYSYFSKVAEHKSYDKEDGALEATVHFTQPSGAAYEDAFWNGEQLVLGEGFPAALDVVGHELSHAYTEFSAGLIAEGPSGALDESFSDFMGVAIEIAEDEEVDWEVGEDLPEELGPLRSLSEPSKYSTVVGDDGETSSYPEHLSEWVATCLDNFGIHVNSTVTSHAFYRAAINLKGSLEEEYEEEWSLEEAVDIAARVFSRGWLRKLQNPRASLEDARAATLAAADEFFDEEPKSYEAVEDAFDEVGINGESSPPSPPVCKPDCAFQEAAKLKGPEGEEEASAEGKEEASAVEMLTTLYKARGELAMPSAAGRHFMPLYEEHIGRIGELVSQDPVLADMTVSGLAEVSPALDGLIEGEGEKFELSKERMAQIEAALKRLAQDDRLYAGESAGELADLIETELKWLNLSSYGGKTYEEGWKLLNDEAKTQMLEEEAVIVDPNCQGSPYPNNFHVNSFYAETPGSRIPGQVSPLSAGGMICGAEVEPIEGKSGCEGEETLNTEVSVQLPPGSKLNASENLPDRSWVGKTYGRAIACAGDETQILYGEAGLLSLESWNSSQCPEAAIACYEGRSTYENEEGSVTGKGYAWVTESEGGALAIGTKPVTVNTENGYEIVVGLGQFRVELCGRAGGVETEGCGGPTGTWLHQNGESSEAGCKGGDGRYLMRAENAAEEETVPVSTCVRWDENAQMQTVGAPNSLNAVSCVPSTSICASTDSEGDAFYATDVTGSSPASWESWSGPGPSPGHAIDCPSETLCLLAAGEVEGGGGNLYRASSLGGSFSLRFEPEYGVNAVSCSSASFCVTAQEGGYIRYSTKPSGLIWNAVFTGSGALNDVSCLSSSFCAAVDDSGNVRVATTTESLEEEEGWTITGVNAEEEIDAIACTSTTSCVAVDGTDALLNLTIDSEGNAEVKTQTVEGAADLTDVTCSGSTCVAVDDEGGIFTSATGGECWKEHLEKNLTVGANIESVSCASDELCSTVDAAGDIAMFDPPAFE